jgi:lipoprotein-anchoring transpeptidase ErfK/SrfK
LQSRPRRLPETTHKWLDINLASQTLVAYEGETPVYATLISSGKADRVENPDESWRTLDGIFHVKSKHLTDTMDGDTAVDGPYSVDDVPYVMYFELAYALHSAFWHNGFGRPRSHGCVNLSPLDARHVFNWADPPLPDGWHSVYPVEGGPQTGIYIHGETPRPGH